jgi:hypothetical protein
MESFVYHAYLRSEVVNILGWLTKFEERVDPPMKGLQLRYCDVVEG